MFPPETETGVGESQPLFLCKSNNGGFMTQKQIDDLFDLLKKRDEEFCIGMEAMRTSVELLSQRQTIASERLKVLEDINKIMSGDYGSTSGNSGRA
nr:hypothetical protein [uncultured Mediterranean phage uvMED]